ncbi:MAG: hypothetical protein JW866_07075, partial [Ignavibacteriales bacterium]|nr:hypothetical protein [Ignavibacteriales bacterium]
FYSDGSFEENKVFIEEEFTDIVFENPDGKQISFILFDSNREILKKVAFVKSFEELFNQATNAPNMIDRFDAIQQFRVYPIETKRDFLCERFVKESYHLIKNEIIYQLSADTNNVKTIDLFKKAIKDIDSKVRQTTLQALKQIPKSLKNDFEILLKDSSYVTIELALDNLSKSFPDNINKYLEITKNEIGWWGKNIRIKWLEIAVSNKQEIYLDKLLEYLSPSFDFQTRINALKSIANLSILDNVILDNIIQCYLYWHTKLSRKAEEVLIGFYDKVEFTELIRNYFSSNELNKSNNKIKKVLNIE